MGNTSGIDISHYQCNAIDWNKLANPTPPKVPPGFIFIKLTDGRTPDPCGRANVTAAAGTGIPYGYYHFAYPDSGNSAVEEATAFYEQASAAGAPTLKFGYMLDLERNHGLSRADFSNWVDTFLKTFQSKFDAPTPPPLMFYGSPGNFNTWFPADHPFGTCPLWVAEYGVAEPKGTVGWDDWLVWQYSETGTVEGISVPVDLDTAKEGFM
jgi:lysozyme